MVTSPLTRYRKGLWAETAACWALRLKGYRIVARRFKTRLGEIDVIAVRGRTLAIVEVKARATRDLAASAISPHQQQRLIRAAHLFLAAHPSYADHIVRFDALLVTPFGWPVHLPSAFEAAG